MFKPVSMILTLLCLIGIVALVGCNAQEQPVPQPIAVAPVMPVPQPIPQPQMTPPPPTPLLPVVQEEPQPATGSGKGGGGGGGNVDAKIKGPATSGEELIGAYSCTLDSKKIDLPLGIKLPPFGCRIYQGGDGTLKLGPTSQSIASVAGTITDPKAAGFHVVGKATFANQTMGIKVRMVRKGVDTFSGSGKGAMNDDKKSAVSYTLVMTKQ
ncbi:MAG: hypothetical protein MUC50_16680 [Myxococcota bacterium]|nr:hypothetical protein [Myxococcota bacterium]